MNKTTISTCLLVVISSFSMTAGAVEYSSGYSLGMASEYDDNVKLEISDEKTLHGFSVSPALNFAAKSERLESSLDTRFDFSRYNISGYNSDDQYLKGKLTYKFERAALGFDAAYTRDTTRTSEVLDTGRVADSAVRKESSSVGGSWQYQLSEQRYLQASVNQKKLDYASANYTDSTTNAGSLALLNEVSERTLLRVMFYLSEFEGENTADIESDSYGVQFGIDQQLSEQLEFSVLAGSAHVKTHYGVGGLFSSDDTTDTYVVDSSLTYRTPRSTIRLGLSRQTTPSGDGYLIAYNRLRLSHSYQLTELSRLNSSVLYQQSDSLDDRINNNRDYSAFSLGYGYNLTEDWRLSTRYNYEFQERETTVDKAESHGVTVSLRYNPQANSWSR